MGLDTQQIEEAFGLKPRDWKREIERHLKAGTLPEPGNRSLAAAGYPELYRVTVFFTDSGLIAWRQSHTLRFPAICCVCGMPATNERQVDEVSVPYCSEHSSGPSRLMIEVGSYGRAPWVLLTGLHEGFLQQTVQMNKEGDILPPWEVFPQYDSETGFWKQGGQFWIDELFGPFWNGLNNAQRTAYLQKWRASIDWRERLALNLDRTHNRRTL
jgi:hypothetical protein